ncbi:MAG TPA: ABC transporter substrate-binding protein [Burkholderiales bacterium]|nr:ABC transporter substrate-binding protein [Burkholderiales bacterium]
MRSNARTHQPPKRTCRGATIAALFWLLCTSLACDAQPSGGPFKVGYLTPVAQPAREQVFRQELQRLGLTEGRNMVIEYRSADGNFDRLPALVDELVRLKVDVIAVRATQAALAAKKGTGSIPIVMVGVDDPVGLGLVASLGRPGGNVTGTASNAVDVVGKQFELVREMLPAAARVSALWNPANAVFQKRQVAEAKSVAAKLRMELQLVEARAAADLDQAVAAVAAQRPHALIVLGDPLFAAHMARIAQLALKHRLPAVYGAKEFAEAGGLAGYGPSYSEAHLLAASYVERIRKGAKPADLPVEQISKFDLAINAKTAKALGIRIPPPLVLRANEVVE